MAWSESTTQIAILASILAALTILYFAARMLGVDTAFVGKAAAKQEEKEMKVEVRKIAEPQRPRVHYPKFNFNEVINDIMVVGVDKRTGCNIVRFKYGPENRLSNFTVVDSPIYIRPQSPIEMMTTDRRKEWNIIEDDELTRLYNEKLTSDLYAKAMMQENVDMKKNSKELVRETIEFNRGMRGIGYGYGGGNQQQGGGYSPFGQRSWSPYRSFNRFGGGGEGGEGEGGEM